jgi:hypothetical protein
MKRWWSYSADLLTGTDSPPGVYRGRFQRRSISSKSFRRIAQFAGGFSAQASVHPSSPSVRPCLALVPAWRPVANKKETEATASEPLCDKTPGSFANRRRKGLSSSSVGTSHVEESVRSWEIERVSPSGGARAPRRGEDVLITCYYVVLSITCTYHIHYILT